MTKPFAISKRMVYDAWKRVKAKRGGAGIDRQSLEEFEEHLSSNLYKVWNRLASGSYFPPPVREVGIPKHDGGVRKLGVPTVGDRVAQTVVKQYLEPYLEPHFEPDSYGYRPGRSAHDAVRVTRQRCWEYDWVVEFDVKGAFDNLEHDLLMKLLRRHTDCRWVLLYVERWLQAPSVTDDGEVTQRVRGTPQGGVVSPLLMNLFMHYAFDRWMRREIGTCPYARYADDGVVHCRTERQARWVKHRVAERFRACGLELHPTKTRLVYCKDSNRREDYPQTQFTFLGFTFRPRRACNRAGQLFTSFLPGASPAALKRMREVIHSWHLPRQTQRTVGQLSTTYNPILAGWWHYYGAFYPTVVQGVFWHFDLALKYWACRKYKRLYRRPRRGRLWLDAVAGREPGLFVHWCHRHRSVG